MPKHQQKKRPAKPYEKPDPEGIALCKRMLEAGVRGREASVESTARNADEERDTLVAVMKAYKRDLKSMKAFLTFNRNQD